MSKRQRLASNIVICDNESPIMTETEKVQSRIRERAFQISLDRGHAGREVEDWLTAESEIIMSAPVEVAEKDGELVIRIFAAGIDFKDVTIMASRDQIMVRADFRHQHEPASHIHICEFKSAMLFRSIRLPHPIDLRTLNTRLEDGILRIAARGQTTDDPSKKKTFKRPSGR